jgi:hypothetical protein
MQLTPFNLAIAMAAGVALTGYVVYILIPAVQSYGRAWERVAAGFMSLFILMALLGVGLTLGFLIVWFYDKYAL